jgi:Cu/Ag efflux protein CusF
MSSIIRPLLTTVFSMTVVMSLPSLAFADDPAGVEHDRPAADQTVGVAGLPRPSTEAFRGVVASVDERNDTIRIRRSPETTEEFRVQDGLLFNAVRYGDLVEVSVENINGAKTIVGLTKE